MGLQPFALGERHGAAPVEPARRGKSMSSMQASGKRSLAEASRFRTRLSARMATSRSSIRPSHSSRLSSLALFCSAGSR